MKFNISAGHNPDGKVGCGAVGLIKESTEARAVTKLVIKYLKEAGHTVYDCTVNDGKNASDVLKKIVKKCNSNDVDLDISIHFNSGRNDKKGDGATGGTEVLVYSENSKSYTYAEKIANSISKLGYRNRGVKERKDLYFLGNTKAPALLIECCFVDDKDDIKLYDTDKLAKAIIAGLGIQLSSKKTTSTKSNDLLVKIKSDTLNIREGAGVKYKVVGMVKKNEVYTIVKRSGTWGKLKSGIGWINIGSKYVIKL
jgi:N-acetylmuramoyl-L-alanine amidase